MDNGPKDSSKETPTITNRLQKLAKDDPEKPAYIFWDRHWKRTVLTRREVWDKSTRCAAFLRRCGIVKGDIVCNTLANSPERVITAFGTLLAGAVSMNGEIFLADGEDIIKNWRESECKAVILDPTLKRGPSAMLEELKHNDPNSHQPIYKGLPHLTTVIPVIVGSEGDFLQDLDNELEPYADDSVGQDDVVFILTTSGSTGFSKLVPHTQRACFEIGRKRAQALMMTPNTVWFNGEAMGWIVGLLVYYPSIGLTRVIQDPTCDNKTMGNLIVHILEFEQCDVSILLNDLIQVILGADAKLTKPMSVLAIGGAPISATLMSTLSQLAKTVVVEYGGTEMATVCHLKVTDPASYENSCVGYPMEDVEVKLIGDDDREVDVSEMGEIYLRGPTVSKGYMFNPDMSREKFLKDGWYRTSDMGYVNEKGQLFVVCRKSFAINHLGWIHYPGWMEVRVDRHPHIKKSAVVGIPHPVHIEDVCLCVIKSPKADHLTADNIKEFCKNLFLTNENAAPIPEYYLFFETFPLTPRGKLDRSSLRKEAIKRVETGALSY